MHTVVEVGDWEHECCGPTYERNAIVELICVVVPGEGGATPRYVASHHGLTTESATTRLRGRVVDVCVRHPDGSVEQIERLPSGAALRGFDDHDDGHLQRPWTERPVLNDSVRFLVTIAT